MFRATKNIPESLPGAYAAEKYRSSGAQDLHTLLTAREKQVARAESELQALRGEIETAQSLQRKHIPESVIGLGAVEIVGSTRQAMPTLNGDLLDIHAMKHFATGILIADVVGKGLKAGMVGSALLSMVQALKLQDQDPAAILYKANLALLESYLKVPGTERNIPGPGQEMEYLDNLWITACYGVLYPDRRFVIARAGHTLPARYDAAGNRIPVSLEASHPLNWDLAMQLQLYDFRVEPDELVLLHTDGLPDIYSPEGKTLGLEPVHALIKASAGQPLQTISDGIWGLVDNHRQLLPLNDDITFTLIRGLKQLEI
jgi:sigma-B regulation protein RsbU (phosphoserine phosphatase)